MAAENNPYFISPANPMAALMSGVQGYDRGQKSQQQNALAEAGRLYAAGDLKGAQAAAAQGGDLKALMDFAELQNKDRSFGLEQQKFGELSRHQGATERLTGQQIAQTGAYQQGQLGVARGELDLKEQTPVKIGTDPFGSELYGVRDSSGGYRAPTLSGGAPQAPTSGATLTGEDYLKTVPQELRAVVKGLANYEINPTTSSTRGGHRERLAAMTKQYDPEYDQTSYPMRAQAVKDFGSGKHGTTIRAFNVATDHLETLEDLTKALQNKDVNLYNKVKNAFSEQIGGTAPTNFNAVKSIVGSEVAKAVVGGQFALQDREEIRQQISNARSEEQLLGVIKQFKRLMGGQVKGLKQQYEDSARLKNFEAKLSPSMLKTMRSMDEAPSGSGEVVIQNGWRYKRDGTPIGPAQ